jgi:hypothetical protein
VLLNTCLPIKPQPGGIEDAFIGVSWELCRRCLVTVDSPFLLSKASPDIKGNLVSRLRSALGYVLAASSLDFQIPSGQSQVARS